MSRTLTASDRASLIRLASSLPKGSPERKAILAGLSRSEVFDEATKGRKAGKPWEVPPKLQTIDLRPLWTQVEDLLLAVKDLRGEKECERYSGDLDKAIQDSDVEMLLSIGDVVARDLRRMDAGDARWKWHSVEDLFRNWKKVSAAFR